MQHNMTRHDYVIMQLQTPLSQIVMLLSKSLYHRVQSSSIQNIWYMGCAVYKYHEYLFFGIVCIHRSHYKHDLSLIINIFKYYSNSFVNS
jgi:hypothetical protein